VDDKFQGLGIGSILLTQLAYIAWVNGFNRFVAYVMPENKNMIYVLKIVDLKYVKNGKVVNYV